MSVKQNSEGGEKRRRGEKRHSFLLIASGVTLMNKLSKDKNDIFIALKFHQTVFGGYKHSVVET